MEKIIFKIFKSRLIFGKYSIKYLISKGSYDEVYFGTNVNNGKNYAFKIEDRNSIKLFLENECYALINLKGPYIPEVISYGVIGNYNILVENLLGKSIWDIWLENNKKLNLKDTCIFAIQALSLLEYVHSKNYLHRDIKPANFLVGDPDNSQIYLIDFGNAKKYRSSKTGKHIKSNKSNSIFGSLIYLSTGAINGIEQTRRDELESLGYVIIYLFLGSLPWSRIKIETLKQALSKIKEIREKTSIANLCRGMPKEINIYMDYVKNLNYEQRPNYEYLSNLFMNVLRKMGENNDLLFSWCEKRRRKIISKRESTSKSNNKSVKNIVNKLLKENPYKKKLNKNLKTERNKNEDKIKVNNFLNINHSNSPKIDKKNKMYIKNNTDLLKINHLKKLIKQNRNINEVKVLFKNRLALFPRNTINKNIIKMKNNQSRKVTEIVKNEHYLSDIVNNRNNLDNNSLNNRNNTKIDKFLNNSNSLKTQENSSNESNIINSKNISNFNYTYIPNISSYVSKMNDIYKVLPTKKKNTINHINNFQNNLRNNKSREKNINKHHYKPLFYKSILTNYELANTNLIKYGLDLDKYTHSPEKNRKNNQSDQLKKPFMTNENFFNTSNKNNLDNNNNIIPKRNLYQMELLYKYGLIQPNSPNNYVF